MSWLDDNADTQVAEPRVDEKWMKIPDPPQGKKNEVKIRILDEEPVGVWRHWLENRPFNCPGIATCPVCKVRMDAKKADPDGFRAKYRMDYRYFFNVLVNGQVKIFSFSSAVGRKLKTFLEKYGDLRDFDVTITKRKTGPLPMNVEYDVLYEGKSKLSEEDTVKAENRYDLSEYIIPANVADLKIVATGEMPDPTAQAKEEPKLSTRATKADMILLESLVHAKGFQLSDFGMIKDAPPIKSVVEKLIQELQTVKSPEE